MQWTNWAQLRLRSKGVAVVAIPLISLTALAALILMAVAEDRRAHHAVKHALQVKTELALVGNILADAETIARGYLLTRNDDFLDVLGETTAPLAGRMRNVESLLVDPLQREHWQQVKTLAAERPITSLLRYAKSTPRTALVPEVLLAESRRVMRKLRTVLGQMQDREDAILAERVAAAEAADRQLVAASVAGVALGTAAALVAVLAFTGRLTRRLEGLRKEATRLAAGEPITLTTDDRDEVGDLSRALADASALLARHTRELDEFFSVSLDLMCIANFEGRFTRVNRAWQAVLGWAPEELVSVPFTEFIHPDDVAATQNETAHLASGGRTVDFRNRYRCRDGTYRWLSWKAVADLETQQIYAAARDVTHERELAEQLEQRVAELAALNQELEAFSYSVSHDLRAPLRHVAGFATLLERRASSGLDEQSRRHLAAIRDSASQMGRLIDDLLAFSRMGRAALNKRTVDTEALVRDVIKALAVETEARTIDWHIRPLPPVHADAALLRVALMNLLSNAVKYTSTRARAVIEVGATSSATGTVLYVRDNGVGFDMQYAHKLFGVFQRLHRAEDFDGTGIGLATVRRIVQRHGGSVHAESAVDAGATFSITLPATASVLTESYASA